LASGPIVLMIASSFRRLVLAQNEADRPARQRGRARTTILGRGEFVRLASRRPAWTTSTLLRFCPKAKARIDQSPLIVDQSARFANPSLASKVCVHPPSSASARHTHRECTRVMPGRQPERSRHGRRAKHSESARPARIASLPRVHRAVPCGDPWRRVPGRCRSLVRRGSARSDN
jgi:hypothetical protein